MADIDIQRKEGPGTSWIWIVVALLVVGLLAWWLWQRTDDRATGTTFDTAPGQVLGLGSPVDNYRSWVQDERLASQDQQRLHAHTAEGIRRLTSSLEHLSDRDGIDRNQFEPRLNTMREHASALDRDDATAQHSQHANQAFTTGAAVLGDLQMHYPQSNADVNQVQQSAQSVSAGQTLAQQQVQVQQYFDRSSEAVQRMNEHRDGQHQTGQHQTGQHQTGQQQTGQQPMGQPQTAQPRTTP